MAQTTEAARAAYLARAEKAERELAEAREKLGLAYETAAKVCDDESARRRKQAADLEATTGNLTQHARWTAGALALEFAAADVRALDPDATSALTARDKRVREAETRACAEVIDPPRFVTADHERFAEGLHAARRRVLARLDQPKAESGE